MLKKLAVILIALTMIVIGSALIASGQDVETTTYNIQISTNEDNISVKESITLETTSIETLVFWIQDDALDIEILIDGGNLSFEKSSIDNTYSCNVSELNISTDTEIKINYNLDKNTDEFEKILQYNTSVISITFDENQIYSSGDLESGNSFTVALQKTTEIITESEVKTIYEVPIWYYAILIVLIILVALSFIFPSKKSKTQKSATKKQVKGSESEELLTTKKALLMEVLKDIEKQHRAKKISDDTYNKLKDQYKQDAVEAMRQIEDSKSKVK